MITAGYRFKRTAVNLLLLVQQINPITYASSIQTDYVTNPAIKPGLIWTTAQMWHLL